VAGRCSRSTADLGRRLGQIDATIEEAARRGKAILRPIAAPEDDAVSMCRPCMLDYTARAVELGAVVREQPISLHADGVNRGEPRSVNDGRRSRDRRPFSRRLAGLQLLFRRGESDPGVSRDYEQAAGGWSLFTASPLDSSSLCNISANRSGNASADNVGVHRS
jgi:hypothetical protein